MAKTPRNTPTVSRSKPEPGRTHKELAHHGVAPFFTHQPGLPDLLQTQSIARYQKRSCSVQISFTDAGAEGMPKQKLLPKHSYDAGCLKAPASRGTQQAAPGYDWRGLPCWQVLPPCLGLALLVGIWALVSMGTASQHPQPAGDLEAGGGAFSATLLPQRAQRPGRGLERAVLAATRGHGLWPGRRVGIPAGFMIGRFEF